MTDTPMPPTPDLPEELLTAIHDLAAGTLPPAEAAALETRIAAEPALAAAYADAQALEARLADETLYPSPLGLSNRIMAFVVPGAAPARPLATLIRVAAVVLVFFSSWLIVGGDTPAIADVRGAAPVVSSLGDEGQSVGFLAAAQATAERVRPDAAEAIVVPADKVPDNAPLFAGVGGLLLIAGGVVLSARWHRRAMGGAA